jgi:hypothetical protein
MIKDMLSYIPAGLAVLTSGRDVHRPALGLPAGQNCACICASGCVIFPIRKMITTNVRQFGAEVPRANKVLGLIRMELRLAFNIDERLVGDLQRGKPATQRGKAASGSPS